VGTVSTKGRDRAGRGEKQSRGQRMDMWCSSIEGRQGDFAEDGLVQCITL